MILSSSDIVLSIISGLVTLVVLSNLICKKSFYQIYDELSKSNQTDEKRIIIIKNLHEYIHEYSNEEILIFNFRFNQFKSNRFYSGIFIIITILFFFVMIELGVPYIYSEILTIFIIPIIYLIPIILIKKRFGKLGDKPDILNLINIFILTVMKIAFICIIFFICVSLILMALNIHEQKHRSSFFGELAQHINYGGLELISSNQLSLAGFFFTFAIGGTVIFSIISNYLKQKNELKDTLLVDSDFYIKWFKSNENNLTFKIQDIAKIDSKIKGYRRALSNLRSELNSDRFYELILPMRRYKLLRSSIFGMYFMGILTLILAQPSINLLFYIFIILSLLFMGLIYINFKDYS